METRVLELRAHAVGKYVICRLCMECGTDSLNIFVLEAARGLAVWEVIRDLLRIEVLKDDGLPDTVCGQCLRKLMEFTEFKEMCLRSSTELRKNALEGGLKIDVNEENIPSKSIVEEVSCEGYQLSHAVSEERPVPGVVCVPIVMENLIDVKEEVDSLESQNESDYREEDYGMDERPVSDVARDPLDVGCMINIKEEHIPSELPAEEETCRQEYLGHNEPQERAMNSVDCDPVYMRNPIDVKVEIDPTEYLCQEKATTEECLSEDESRGRAVSNDIHLTRKMQNLLKSTRGRSKISDDGYVYLFDKLSSNGEVSFWRCEQKKSCRARIHTEGTRVVKRIGSHNHARNVAKLEATISICAMKRRAEQTMEPTAQIVNESISSLSQGAQGVLPNQEALKKIIRRKRNDINRAPANPQDLLSLNFPEEYQVYQQHSGVHERFLLADSGPGCDRVVIFGTKKNLTILKESKFWFVDGTFKSVPTLFSQVYAIMAERLGEVIPVLYILLPSKTWAVYSKMFHMLKDLQPELSPERINCSYDVALYYAIRDCFPGVQIGGCFSYLFHNVKKKIGNLELLKTYRNDADFAFKVNMIMSLAFVPPEDLDTAVDVVSAHLPSELTPLLEWFEYNYVGRSKLKGGRQLPLFPVSMWSVHDRVVNDEITVHKHAEAAHRRLQCQWGMEHSSIWEFIDTLRKIQKGQDAYDEQLVRGVQAPKKLKKKRDTDERIRCLVLNYDSRYLIDFLRGLSHNCGIH